ncbi:MAG: 2-amino-4-hydroxy-6-hydroxymethyldihydropteridine diphosphokinase [Marinifilaceae bacterium]
MAKVYLLLGGNLGNRQEILNESIKRLEIALGKELIRSSFYETEPWGFEHDQNFLNQVVVLETAYSPREVLIRTQKIELDLGRVRGKQQYSERTIDIDILFYEDRVVDEPDLVIPHPRIAERMFALSPLVQIAEGLVHPVLGKTMQQLQKECPDQLKVIRIDSENEEK